MNDSPTSSLIVCVCVHLYVRTCCGSRCNTPTDVTTNCSVPTYLPTLLHAHFPYSSNLEDTSGGGEGGGLLVGQMMKHMSRPYSTGGRDCFFSPAGVYVARHGGMHGKGWLPFVLPICKSSSSCCCSCCCRNHISIPFQGSCGPELRLCSRARGIFFSSFSVGTLKRVCVCVQPFHYHHRRRHHLFLLLFCPYAPACVIEPAQLVLLLLPFVYYYYPHPPSVVRRAREKKSRMYCTIHTIFTRPRNGSHHRLGPQMMMSPSFCFCLFQLFFLSPFVAVSPFFAPPRLFSVAPPSSPPSFFSFFRP